MISKLQNALGRSLFYGGRPSLRLLIQHPIPYPLELKPLYYCHSSGSPLFSRICFPVFSLFRQEQSFSHGNPRFSRRIGSGESRDCDRNPCLYVRCSHHKVAYPANDRTRRGGALLPPAAPTPAISAVQPGTQRLPIPAHIEVSAQRAFPGAGSIRAPPLNPVLWWGTVAGSRCAQDGHPGARSKLTTHKTPASSDGGDYPSLDTYPHDFRTVHYLHDIALAHSLRWRHPRETDSGKNNCYRRAGAGCRGWPPRNWGL